jgi:hypothetical protein
MAMQFNALEVRLNYQPIPLLVPVSRTTVARLGQQIASLKGTNAAKVDEMSLIQSTLAQVQRENTMLRCENSALHEGHQRQLQVQANYILHE